MFHIFNYISHIQFGLLLQEDYTLCEKFYFFLNFGTSGVGDGFHLRVTK